MDSQLQRDMGRIEGRLESVEDRMGNMDEKIDRLLETVNSARGGWHAIMWFGGSAAAIGAAAAKLFMYFMGKHQ